MHPTANLAAVVLIEERHLLLLMLYCCVLMVEVLVVRRVVLVGGARQETCPRSTLEQVSRRLVSVVAGQRVRWLVVLRGLGQRGRMVM